MITNILAGWRSGLGDVAKNIAENLTYDADWHGEIVLWLLLEMVA